MKPIGIVVIVAATVITAYLLLGPSGEQTIESPGPAPDPRPLTTPTPPAASESPEVMASAPEPPPPPAPPASTSTTSPGTPSTTDSSAGPPSLFTQFEAQPVDPQWSQENEIRLENYLFANEDYNELDIESIQCKASLCEIRAYEKADTVWARVVHNLATDQGWNQNSWQYADYYDKDGKRLIRTVVGRKAE